VLLESRRVGGFGSLDAASIGAKSKVGVAQVASFADGKIEAFVGPQELGAADNLEEIICEFIRGARSALDIAVQELDSTTIAQAILDARWRGVNVNLFLEQDYLRSELTGKPPKLPKPKAGETPEQALRRVQWEADETDLAENRKILSALLRSDIEVKGDFNPKIFHQKFILRDYRNGRATKPGDPALLTGSANFTMTDTHRNLNHVVIFNTTAVCKQYEREFNELRQGRFGRLIHEAGDPPKVFDLAGIPTKVLFAPEHAPELEIMKQMLKGKHEVFFAIFTFAGSSGIDDTMLALAGAGMTVTGVIDRGQGAQRWAAAKELVNHPNISLYQPTKASGVRKLHHKLMVIDERIVVAGSFNYTLPANDYNDENIFVLGSDPYSRCRMA
jgi:phosphatidylserine/phosphatidylglycerophosphate/cardiolipin synthase-like enzyme